MLNTDLIPDYDEPELPTCEHAAFTDRWGRCSVCVDDAEYARIKGLQVEA
jgi:hypothetical protein